MQNRNDILDDDFEELPPEEVPGIPEEAEEEQNSIRNLA
jgi:hypothetical protein